MNHTLRHTAQKMILNIKEKEGNIPGHENDLASAKFQDFVTLIRTRVDV